MGRTHLTLAADLFAAKRFVLSNLTSTLCSSSLVNNGRCFARNSSVDARQELPTEADVVVIGGGSIGCSAAYHLAKFGAGKVVLLEKDKLTAGTTWHTSGLLWRVGTNELDVQIVAHTHKLMTSLLSQEVDTETGWIQTGGLFTACNQQRIEAYKRMTTIAKAFGIESHILSASEIPAVHPLLSTSKFVGALYSPHDGTLDPTGTCTAYTKAAKRYGAKILEGCKIESLNTRTDDFGIRRICSVDTNLGTIKANNVINCAGVWAPSIGRMIGVQTPQVVYRQAYAITQSIEGAHELPNVRHHDGSMYIKRQGDTVQVGGYENNPVLCEQVASDFAFGLYDVNWDTYGPLLETGCDIMPSIAKSGIRSTICGPESFTPDGKPLVGESPVVRGFFYASGFNGGGMMLGGGAGKQIALLAITGKPELDMFTWDIRRFPSNLVSNKTWVTERSHESYVTHYGIVFPNDQPLAGRNVHKDALHQYGCEVPSYFTPDTKHKLKDYDFYGAYGNTINKHYSYRDQLKHDHTFGYPGPVHETIGRECMTCRTSCVVFNTSYMGKLVLEGPDATKAAKLLFSRDVTADPNYNTSTYTLMLNDKGGIESDLVVCKMDTGDHDFDYYLTVKGGTAEYCKSHINDVLSGSGLNYNVKDRTEELAMLSLQGPKSQTVLKELIEGDLPKSLKFGHFALSNIAGIDVGVTGFSFVGEMGYEISCESEHAVKVYEAIMREVEKNGGCDAGYRAMESLSIEAGFYNWGHSLRADDSPLEARLLHLCDDNRPYHGSSAVAQMKEERPKKSLAYFTVDDQVQLFGAETIWRSGKVVGFTRNGAHAFHINKGVSMGYVNLSENYQVSAKDYVLGGNYEIERNCVKHKARVYLQSPFDPKRLRMRGLYKSS